MVNSTRTKNRKYWESRIPGLDNGSTHWWLEGDGGLIIATNDLTELIDVIEANYDRSLRLYILRARQSEDGDLVVQDKPRYLVSDYQKDKVEKKLGYKVPIET